MAEALASADALRHPRRRLTPGRRRRWSARGRRCGARRWSAPCQHGRHRRHRRSGHEPAPAELCSGQVLLVLLECLIHLDSSSSRSNRLRWDSARQHKRRRLVPPDPHVFARLECAAGVVDIPCRRSGDELAESVDVDAVLVLITEVGVGSDAAGERRPVPARSAIAAAVSRRRLSGRIATMTSSPRPGTVESVRWPATVVPSATTTRTRPSFRGVSTTRPARKFESPMKPGHEPVHRALGRAPRGGPAAGSGRRA